jgi:antirestriction protein
VGFVLTIFNDAAGVLPTAANIIKREKKHLATSTQIIEQSVAEGARGGALTFPAAADAGVSAPEGAVITWEFCVYLRALGSYLKISTHPFSEAERASLLTRSFHAETRVALDSLLRCTETLKSSSFVSRFTSFQPDGHRPGGAPTLTPESGQFLTSECARFASGVSILKDLYSLYDCVIGSDNVSFETWLSLAGAGARKIRVTEFQRVAEEIFELQGRSSVPTELSVLASQITPDSLSADVSTIFARLYGMLDLLRLVETALAADDPLKQTLPLFTLLREESRALLDLIVARTLRIDGLDPAVHEYLDGVAYAIRMELRKAFEHELVGLAALRPAPQVYGKVENAHGLLRDCFQQSVIAVARAFDARIDGAKLFDNFRTKLEQSLLLRRELWDVLAAVRHAEDEHDQAALRHLMHRLSHFRDGSLRFLMYKDWEAFEMFVEEASAAKSSAELHTVLHRFRAFLETLFGQINMRAVLADRPFVPDAPQG